jgi:hypothetical protein
MGKLLFSFVTCKYGVIHRGFIVDTYARKKSIRVTVLSKV